MADATIDFFVLTADANRDASVDLTDFSYLAANFNTTGATFAQGDFNYDSNVDLSDFTLLASRFNTTLPPAAPATAFAAATFSSTRISAEPKANLVHTVLDPPTQQVI
jgi:hypothetical protein